MGVDQVLDYLKSKMVATEKVNMIPILMIYPMCGVQGLQNWYIVAVCTSNDMLQLANFRT